ncbi:MAG TPA: beta-ketoacyl-[acyl-carrier-protein] synthase family protein [Bdellovibrionales bacterium]|nr:beta-ketoacyl-[acyl-carrier-protein] synthase family protein [Bdellovibrionales bacterium]
MSDATNVYITGMGAISSLGINVPSMFTALLENKSGVKHYPDWAKYNGLHSHVGGPAPEYDIMKVPRTARRTMSRMSEMSVLATLEAMGQADLQAGAKKSTPRIALCMGSTTGSPENLELYFKKLIERGGPEGQMGTTFFKVMNHSVVANVAAALEFKGPVFSPSSACATSAQAMILGWELLQSGLYDIVIAGGADELHYTSAAVFDIVMAASRNYNDSTQRSPRPFDIKRDGLVVAEGAAVVVMESESSMQKRGARPLARFDGGAYLCDASHMSQSSRPAMVEVMTMALERARRKSSEIGYVNAHATGTVQGDQEEAQAIGDVFGKQIPVSSLKGHFGHSLAACGTLEAIACVEMMRRDVLLPTRNLHEVDPACAHVFHLQEARKTSVRTIMSNNFAFGGMNTSVVLSFMGG